MAAAAAVCVFIAAVESGVVESRGMSTQAVEAAVEVEAKCLPRDGVVVVPIFGGGDGDPDPTTRRDARRRLDEPRVVGESEAQLHRFARWGTSGYS